MKGLLFAMLLVMTCHAQAGDEWTIDWYTIDGGGEIAATSGKWELSGTIGQPDATEANAASGGGWSLTGGFWGWLAEYLDVLFGDRFEKS